MELHGEDVPAAPDPNDPGASGEDEEDDDYDFGSALIPQGASPRTNLLAFGGGGRGSQRAASWAVRYGEFSGAGADDFDLEGDEDDGGGGAAAAAQAPAAKEKSSGRRKRSMQRLLFSDDEEDEEDDEGEDDEDGDRNAHGGTGAGGGSGGLLSYIPTKHNRLSAPRHMSLAGIARARFLEERSAKARRKESGRPSDDENNNADADSDDSRQSSFIASSDDGGENDVASALLKSVLWVSLSISWNPEISYPATSTPKKTSIICIAATREARQGRAAL